MVFNNGNSKGLTVLIPLGGQNVPISVLGETALWKKAQKIAKKKYASLTINNPIPMFNPLCTADVWLPKYVASVVMSLNQKHIELTNPIKEIYKNINAKVKPCIVNTTDVVNANKVLLVVIGQIEGETKWKGWDWKLLFTKFVALLLL